MAGLYLHIPFCTDKCFYCDFFSGNQLYILEDYVNAIILEINLRSSYIKDNKIDTIYFGGGTPSLLNRLHFERIFDAIKANFLLANDIEVTIECNPENIDSDYVEDLWRVGFNRISLGIQFLDDNVLKKYNRNHTKELIFNAISFINKSNFDNLSIDLIYSVPGIADLGLKDSLNLLSNYDIKHISAYCLTISKNSQLFWKIKKGEVIENDEGVFLSQYKIIEDYCNSNGYRQYEISNYAKEGFISKHNFSYWNNEIYLGVGVTAHSYNLISRQWNGSNIKQYIRDLNVGIVNFDREELTEIQIYNEYIILRLRTFQGISKDFVRKEFNDLIFNHLIENISDLMEKGHFKMVGSLIVPKKEDFLLADYLAQKLMI